MVFDTFTGFIVASYLLPASHVLQRVEGKKKTTERHSEGVGSYIPYSH